MFLEFIECAEKTGKDIAELIFKELQKHGLDESKLRGQGYDNGSNMSGKFNGCQAKVLERCPYAILSSCTLHSRNLVGVDSAKCCPTAITFFGSVQKVYVLFSSSPKRWEILQKAIGESLHSQSETRWTARIKAVKPFAAHLGSIAEALKKLNKDSFPSLTQSNLAEIRGLKKYVSSYTCLLMSSVWFKVLKMIDIRNQIIQAQDCTLDVAFKNIHQLLTDLKDLRNRFDDIVNETSLVAESLGMNVEFPSLRQVLRVKRGSVEMTDEERFKFDVYYVLLDSVISGITVRFQTMRQIHGKFSFLWELCSMDDEELSKAAKDLAESYPEDLNGKRLMDEVESLKLVHRQNFGKESLPPLKLLNKMKSLGLHELFPECSIALTLFLTIPVSVASGERSFSHLNLIKSDIRSTMCQDRLNNLATLNMNCNVARNLDFSDIITKLARRQVSRNTSFF